MAGQGEVLVEVATSLGSELQAGVTRVQAKAEALRDSITSQAGAAQGVAEKLQAALLDLTPVPEDKVSGRASLDAHALHGVLLTGMEIGQLLGRLIGVVLSVILSPALAAITALIVLPASYLTYAASAPDEKDRHLAAIGLATLAGLLNGVAVRAFKFASIVPEALVAVTSLLVARFGGPALSKQADRTPLLGALVGARLVLFLGLDFILGTLKASSFLANVLNSAAYGAVLQLGWANAASPGLGGLCGPEKATAALELAAFLPAIAIDLALSPIAGYAGSE